MLGTLGALGTHCFITYLWRSYCCMSHVTLVQSPTLLCLPSAVIRRGNQIVSHGITVGNKCANLCNVPGIVPGVLESSP